jgi:hypothetical protein
MFCQNHDLGRMRILLWRQRLVPFGLEPGIFVAVDVGVFEIVGVVGDDKAVRLERVNVRLDLRPLRAGVFVRVLVEPEHIHRAVVGQEVGQLFFDEPEIIALRFRRQAVHILLAGLQHVVLAPGIISGQAIIKPDLQPARTEGVHKLAHEVALALVVVRERGDVVRGVLAVPQRPAAGVFGGEDGVFHAGGLGGIGPLAAIQLRRREAAGVFVAGGPLPLVVAGHAVMDEHPKLPREKFFLAFGQRTNFPGKATHGEQHGRKDEGECFVFHH